MQNISKQKIPFHPMFEIQKILCHHGYAGSSETKTESISTEIVDLICNNVEVTFPHNVAFLPVKLRISGGVGKYLPPIIFKTSGI